MSTTKLQNMADNISADVNNYMDLYRAHSVVHPDRDLCGGVGACLMLRTEYDAMQEIETRFQRAAEEGLHVSVTFFPVTTHIPSSNSSS